jgi:hypothetical protein
MTERRAHQQPSWALAKTTSTKGALAELANIYRSFCCDRATQPIRQHDRCRPCRTGLLRVLPLAASVNIASINCERQQPDRHNYARRMRALMAASGPLAASGPTNSRRSTSSRSANRERSYGQIPSGLVEEAEVMIGTQTVSIGSFDTMTFLPFTKSDAK